MRRAALIVFLALLTFQVSGLAAVCGDRPCDDDACPGEAAGGQCAPNCHYCSCCSLPTALEVTGVALAPPDTNHTSWFLVDERLTSPAPADILHVPKPLLA